MTPIEIDVNEVKELLDSSAEFLLLDCRRYNEHDFCRIEASQLIPMQEISDRTSELEQFREQQIVIYCHHGVRSLRVAQWLREQGFENAQSMQGGIDVWSQEIDLSIPRY